MGTTADKLQHLINGKQLIVNSVNNKANTNYTIDSKWSDISTAIDNISVGIVPEGVLNITSNNTYDVTNYASVVVNVPIPSGYIKPSGTLSVTSVGTYDVTNYASATFSVGTETKTVTPSASTQNVTPSSGKYLTKVTVNPIPSNYIIPSGTLTVTENGTHNVSTYANVEVNVESSASAEFANGTAWVSSTAIGNCNFLYHVNGVWYTSTNTTNYTSNDGKTWNVDTTLPCIINFITKYNDMWQLSSNSSSNKGIYYSRNGSSWTQSNVTSGYFHEIKFVAGIWLAAGYGGLYYSTNGTSWTKSTAVVSTNVYGITEGAGKIIVYGSGGIYYSTDGINWTKATIAKTDIRHIIYANGKFVSIGGYGIYYSTDGINWTATSISSIAQYKIHFAEGIWNVGIYNSGIRYSTDGINWIQTNVTSGYCYIVKYYCGIYIAGTSNGMYYSYDGITWTQGSNVAGKYLTFDKGIWVTVKDTTTTPAQYSIIWERPA